MIRADHCDNKNWRLDELDSVIEREVSRLLFDPDYYQILVKARAAEVKAAPKTDADVIRDKISDIAKQIDRMMDLYQEERIPIEVLSARIDKLHREKTALEEQLSAIEPPKPKSDFNDDEALEKLLNDFAASWDSAGLDEKRHIVSTLIRRITLDGEQVKIEWAFLD